MVAPLSTRMETIQGDCSAVRVRKPQATSIAHQRTRLSFIQSLTESFPNPFASKFSNEMLSFTTVVTALTAAGRFPTQSISVGPRFHPAFAARLKLLKSSLRLRQKWLQGSRLMPASRVPTSSKPVKLVKIRSNPTSAYREHRSTTLRLLNYSLVVGKKTKGTGPIDEWAFAVLVRSYAPSTCPPPPMSSLSPTPVSAPVLLTDMSPESRQGVQSRSSPM